MQRTIMNNTRKYNKTVDIIVPIGYTVFRSARNAYDARVMQKRTGTSGRGVS